MKSPLLSLSLIANAVLLAGVAYLVLIPPTLPRTGKLKGEANRDLPKPASPSHSAATAASISPATTPATDLWQSPADVQAWLLASGAPLKVRYAVAQTMILEKYRAAYEAVRFPPGTKRWQRPTSQRTPEQIDQLSAIRLQREEELKQLMGAEYAIGSFGEDTVPKSGIPAEKWVEINRVTHDYFEARQKMGRTWTPDARRLMDEEMNADLRKILTPAEFELHQAYESNDGSRLQRALAGLDIDDETYLRAFRAVAELKNRNPKPNYASDFRLEEIEAIKKVVGAEGAAIVAMNQDSTFREVGSIYSTAGLTPDALLDRHQAWLQFHTDIGNFQKAPGQLDDSQRALVRSYRDRLTEGLSASGRADFDRTRTGIFMARLLGGK